MDLRHLCQRTGLERDEITDIILTFCETSRLDLEHIRAGIAENDAERVVRAAHSIRGAALTLSLDDIAGLAAAIERHGLSGHAGGTLQNLERLTGAVQAVMKMVACP